MANNLAIEFMRCPLTFLSRYKLSVASVDAGVRRFSFERTGANRVGIEEAKLIPCPDDEVGVLAYGLPYGEGVVHESKLGADAGYMFTVTVSGCTIHYETGVANPIVLHAAGDATADVVDPHVAKLAGSKTWGLKQMDEMVADMGFANDPKAVAVTVAVVGHRKIDGWHFYSQMYGDSIEDPENPRFKVEELAR